MLQNRFMMGLFFTSLVLPTVSRADEAVDKGTKIAQEFSTANEGFIGETAVMEMILTDAHGASITREMNGKILEVPTDGDKSMIEFLKPLDVKGTKMLTWAHRKGSNDQWLYLPTIKRPKRISSSNQSASFMGSEFSYEDLGSQEVDKYKYRWLRDEKDGAGIAVHVVERTPVDTESGYSKEVVWMAKANNGPSKVEYYDRKGELLKIASFEDYKNTSVSGKSVWRPNRIVMENVQTKKKSTMVWRDRKIGAKLSDKDFTQQALE